MLHAVFRVGDLDKTIKLRPLQVARGLTSACSTRLTAACCAGTTPSEDFGSFSIVRAYCDSAMQH